MLRPQARQIVVVLLTSLVASALGAGEDRIRYPQTKRGDQVDDYHGTKVADPYRWLEDDVRTVEGSGRLGRGREQGHVRLSRGDPPARDDPQAADRAVELRAVLVAVQGRRALLLLQERRPAEPGRALRAWTRSTAEPRVLLDPNTWSKDGTVALAGMVVQRRRQVRGLRPFRGRLRLDDLARPGDRLAASCSTTSCKWIKFSGAAWTKDGKGSSTAATTSRRRAPSSRR